MKIRWLGHSAFVLTDRSGTKVLTDPYESGCYGGAVGYKPITEKVDVVTISHKHEDHSCLKGLPMGFETVTSPGRKQAAGITIVGTETYHDTSRGKERGNNIVYVFEMDGLRICHLGDLGHRLDNRDIAAIGKVDVLMIPVGGHFTIGPEEAVGVIEALSPSIVIPMHFKTEALDFPVGPVDDFLSLVPEYEVTGRTEIEITRDDLGKRRIIVLDHEL
jgi:L-ascorbate metabolism protein UlaG (beta-lactamase superfamily)